MTTPRTGADRCPGLLRPFHADDGAIVRLRVPGGVLPLGTLQEVLAIGTELGAPVVQLTSRGNLQLRALPDPLPAAAVQRLDATGLLPSATHERVRNILAAPLAPHLQPLVRELDTVVMADPELAGLSGRWLFALTDATGSVLTEPWDVAWQGLTGDDGLLLAQARDGVLGMPCPRGEAVGHLVALARAFVAHRDDERMWNLRDLEPSHPAFEGLRPTTPVAAAPLTPGRHGDAVVAGVPLGMLRQAHLDALGLALGPGATVGLTPWRSLVVADTADVERLTAAGLVTEPGSPWARLSACVGAPACARTSTPTMDIATQVAGALTEPGPRVHVVGCDRRCGEPRGVDHLTVVAPHDAASVLAAVGGPAR